ncbi:MAG UNVERIFIED_CONTAM: hypothetical protein LVR18_42430 [Planctomycetaceae bacterium]
MTGRANASVRSPVRRDALLAAEAMEQAQFDKKLAEEEVWIRQGIKARRRNSQRGPVCGR